MGLLSTFDRTIANLVPLTPTWLLRRFARRYVAGETLDDALAVVRRLQAQGAMATLDVLGEEISDVAQGEETVLAYEEALAAIARDALPSNVSIKLTALGLKLDPTLAYERLRRVVEKAREHGNFVRIDMEDSSTTTLTIDYYRRLRDEGFANVGLVIQAYLRRSRTDVEELVPLKPSYRLCKGIYVEPAEIAFKQPQRINQSYEELLTLMFETGSYVGVATHDHAIVAAAEERIRRFELKREDYEFQMLLGVDEALGARLIADGHRLRIYVPYGRDWRAYCIRRLKENPKIGRYVLMGMFRR